MSEQNLDWMRRDIENAREKYLLENPVISVFDALRKYTEEFESTLDSEHEIAVMLTSFGGIQLFHAQTISYSEPNLITFYGVTPEGEKVQLVQHVSQLNFMLKAVKKIEEKPFRVGFVHSE